MIEGKITFDRFIRWMMLAALVGGVFFVVNYLSNVLLPFFVAWLLAYLMYPLVSLVQYKLHVPTRPLSIIVALLFVISIMGGLIWLIIPPMIEQTDKILDIAVDYIKKQAGISDIPQAIEQWVVANNNDIDALLANDDVTDLLKQLASKLYGFAGKAWSTLHSMVAVLFTLMYLFFILMDYEHLSKSWIRIFPADIRPFWSELAGEVKKEMNSYVRGQSLVALTMGILFCIGFTIIGFPMAIPLGILIGVLDLVPYLHSAALIPTIILAGLKAIDTGDSFWIILLSALAVFAIVQVIIDMVVTPKVMGKAMGLNPAILLLSLSVWGALLGFIGLIVALPLTTLIIAYYKRYVTHESESSSNEEMIGMKEMKK